MIRHSVIFRLRHPHGSVAEQVFLTDSAVLAGIPGVERFERLRQVSPTNEFDLGLSMEFADQAAYDAYTAHPDHVVFVTERWIPEVADFSEIDLVPLDS